MHICLERVWYVQSRLKTARDMLAKKGFLISEIQDAFSMAEQPLENVMSLTKKILRQDDNIKV